MSDRYKGAILSPTAPTVTSQSAGGIYTLSQQTQYQGQGVWPTAVNYPINNSLRFRRSASAYLNRTFGTPTNGTTWTISYWAKLGILGRANHFAPNLSTNEGAISIESDFALYVNPRVGTPGGAGTNYFLGTTQVFRDPSAWYHIVVALDTTQATASNRVKVYVNGTQVTAFSTANYPPQNSTPIMGSAVSHAIGRVGESGYEFYYDGLFGEMNYVDGVALTPSSFGTTDAYGIWQPIPYTGAYGTNGFYLPFTDNSALTTSSNVGLGKDFSGNGNYWVTNNISITAGSTYDSMKDVPTNTNSNTANYFVLNPLVAGTSSVLSNGNLTFTNSAGTGNQCTASMFVTSGSYYFEATLTTAGGGGTSQFVLVGDGNTSYSSNGQIYSGGVLQTTVATLTSDDVVGLAFTPGGSVTYYKNGTSVYTGGVGGVIPIVNGFSGTVWNINFGQRPFVYTPPVGFKTLNTTNLPTPTIGATASTTANKYFDIALWTGDAVSPKTVYSSLQFQPDMTWAKTRSVSTQHALYDAVRGAGSGKILIPNTTDPEGGTAGSTSDAQYGYLSSFNSNGISTVTGSSGINYFFNASGVTYVGWNWRASNATAVTNTAGSITSTVSANTTAGFSIVTYTGTGSNATIGHGLSAAPSMMIVKRRNGAANWFVYHSVLGATQYIYLDATAAAITASGAWNNTAPTSTVFSVGNFGEVNLNTGTYVAYCFAQVAGYSAFGSYTGNGSSDGPFVYTGFRPRFVLLKVSSGTTANWVIVDTSRNTYNVANSQLNPDSADAEFSGSNIIDIVSNGFKLRNTPSTFNGNGNTYIYAAFAENPFKYSLAR